MKIQCTGVGQLLHTKKYIISWKMTLPYNPLSPEIDVRTFANIEVFTAEYLT